MSEPAPHQKLSAILFADIAGYSQLMDRDEAGTYEAWRKARAELVEPTVAAHRGRVIKYTGDGFLAEFAAAETAVTCAVKLQAAFEPRAPLRLRIGVHLGDVYHEGDDVYGDGVNVASRLEGLAEPGAICISGTVHDLVQKKVQIEFTDGGRRALKNIAEPIQVWHIRTATEPPRPAAPEAGAPARAGQQPETATLVRNLLAAFKRPGIAVLPFDNLSGDAEQEYFADGLSEDLITELARTGTLFVIARNSTFVYKRKAVDVPKVARELGVGFVLEGSVRRAGQRVRVTAQLIDGGTGGHLWAERYDRDLTDIFAVQDEITRHIVSALSLSLSPVADRNIGRKSTASIEAYDLFLRARDSLFRTDRAGAGLARDLFERAIAIDPNFASAHAGLAQTHMLFSLNQWGEDQAMHQRLGLNHAEAAVRLNPRDPYGHWSMSGIYGWKRDFERALASGYRALELDPAFLVAYSGVGGAMLGLGRADEALAIFETLALGGAQVPPVMLHYRARALFLLGRYEEAAAVLRERIVLSPDTDISRALLAALYGHLGKIDDARAIWDELFKVNPAYSLEARRAILPAVEFDLMLAGLAKAGLQGSGK